MGLRWRSITERVAVLLLLGAIVNLAVACGCALFLGIGKANALAVLSSDHPPRWSLRIFERRGAARITSEVHREQADADPQSSPVRGDLVPRWSRAYTAPTEAEIARQFSDIVIEDARGWPMLAMKSDIMSIVDGKARFGGIALRGNHQYPDVFRSMRALPTQPIWTGFALNTMLYATILWLLFGGPFAVRRWWRSRRGLCPACAYPVGTSLVCTECGKPLKVRRVQPALP